MLYTTYDMYNTRKFFMNSKVFLILLLAFLPTSTFCAQPSGLSNKSIFCGTIVVIGGAGLGLLLSALFNNAQRNALINETRATLDILKHQVAAITAITAEVPNSCDIAPRNRREMECPQKSNIVA